MVPAICMSLSVILLMIGIDLSRNDSYLSNLVSSKKFWQSLAEIVGPAIASWMPTLSLEQIEQKLTWAGNPLGLNAKFGNKISFLLGA